MWYFRAWNYMENLYNKSCSKYADKTNGIHICKLPGWNQVKMINTKKSSFEI